MGELTETLIPPPGLLPPPALVKINHHPRPMPVREDCWSEDATFTLIEAWGQHYLDLNRGNLRQKHWQEVADEVNASHGHNELGKKGPRFRTDIQCKNRIDTLKKKYKVEKSRVLESRGSYTSPWSFFTPLDSLLAGSPSSVKKSSPIPSSFPSHSSPLATDMQQQLIGVGPPMAVPLLPYRRMSATLPTASPALPQKRPSPVTPTPLGVDYSNFRRNYSAVAAAAAADTDEEEEEEDEGVKREEEECEGMDDEMKQTSVMGEAEGIRNLAKAIERFGEVYARVESEKQRQMVELEKQKMQLAKEMELQRMQMLVELQVQFQKVKRVKRSTNSNDAYR